MKIYKKKVVASTIPIEVPEPFKKYYRLMPDDEFEEYTGMSAHPSPCEEAEGYDIKSFSYAVAKPEYDRALSNTGLDIVELVTSDWDPDKLMLAYVVHDRIYPVDISDMPEEDGEDLYDRDAVMQAIKEEFGIDDYDAYTIYDWYDAESAQDDFDSVTDFINYIRDDIYDMLDACDDEVQADRIREAIESSTKVSKSSVTASVDTGLQYWYLTKHGLGPGMLPNDVHVIDAIDDGWDTYVLIDKMLTTDELKYYDLKEKCPPEELMACSITSAECTKVDEDKDSIHYVVASDDDPDWMTDDEKAFFKEAEEEEIEEEKPDWIVDYDLKYLDEPGAWEKEEKKRIARELDDEADYYDRMYGEGDYEDIEGAEEVEEEVVEEEEEDFLNQPNQEFKSDKTAVNGKQGKLPAVFKKANIPNGALVLDYGGGTPESEAVAQAYLDQFEAKEMLYDPFNQTPEHNRNVVKELKSNGGADVAVCSNVLNVLKEQEVRLDLLNKIKKLLKSGATAYISVYEGSGAGQGSATQNNESFQNNMKLGSYLEEVQSIFPDATRKGAVIVAPNTSSAKKVESSTDIASIDLNQLEADIKAGCEEYLTGPEGGFSPSGSPKESKWDMNADEIYFVEIENEPEESRIRIEVRVELGYDSMIKMSEILDRIVEQYDPDAYFDIVTSGIMEAYIYDKSYIYNSTVIEGGPNDSWNEKMLREHEAATINPPEDDEDYEDDNREDLDVDFDLDFYINVFEDGDWSESEDDENNSEEIVTDEMGTLSTEQVEEDTADLLTWNIPANPGKYHIKGHVHLVYKPTVNNFGDPAYEAEMKYSKVTDIEVTLAGKVDEPEEVESSTEVVEAAMSNEDVEYAILNDKPFDLDSFKNYIGENHEGEIRADQLEVGDIFRTNSAEVVDYGTVLKVLGINEPGVADDYFDYTLRCEVVEPASDRSSSKAGDEVSIWYDADEYVGELIPV